MSLKKSQQTLFYTTDFSNSMINYLCFFNCQMKIDYIFIPMKPQISKPQNKKNNKSFPNKMKTLNNLFSIFDPSSSYMKLNWIIFITTSLLCLFIIKSKLSNLIKKSSSKVIKEINQAISSKKTQGFNLFLTCWLITIFCHNSRGLIPFSFTITAQISITFSTALSIWLAINLKRWIKSTKKSIAHLVPTGAPKILMPILVLIELSRSLIRPITLSVRLSANIIAGHLIISLLGEAINLTNRLISIPCSTILIVLEIAVAGIQAYVFTILLSLYYSEVYKITNWFPISKSHRAILKPHSL